MGRDSSRDRAGSERIDPITGEEVQLLNTFVRGDDHETPTPDEMRVLFDELRRIDGLEHAKESIVNWRDYTLPGDPYPIPRGSANPAPEVNSAVKGDHGYLVDALDDDAIDAFVDRVFNDARSNPSQ